MDSLLVRISKDLLLPNETADYLIRSAPHRYKVYTVPKRSGSGVRIIAQPAKEVKKLQYWVMKKIFPSMPVHPNAIAYVKNKNILDNCAPHAKHPFILKLDFKDFFPSVKGEDFLNYAKGNHDINLTEAELIMLMKILFWQPKREDGLRLSIGAPSSPYLSNAIMYNFDSQMEQHCSQIRINYTRYADDLTFSMEDSALRGLILQKVKEVLNQLPFPTLEINSRKTVFGSKAHRRMVTGLILSNDGDVSLGRDKKRYIRAQVHHFANGKLNDEQRDKLRGMLAYVRHIEPDFLNRLQKKYGSNIISSI